MKFGKMLSGGLAILLLAACAPRVTGASETALRMLREGGAVEYALKESYGGGIQQMYLGYDAAGQPILGVASRETPTYQRALTFVAVVREGDGYVIRSVEIPDLGSFHGKSQDYAREAVNDIAGRTLTDATQARALVDAVTGATQYKQAIYVSSSLMATRIIGEIEANPDWERSPLP